MFQLFLTSKNSEKLDFSVVKKDILDKGKGSHHQQNAFRKWDHWLVMLMYFDIQGYAPTLQ